ncbi:Hypothetical_protein [Hexamita inflata]|uniref:Hypothetical_protein n=1 Tax=Hexamita inflata TaxID=28002 RepID=A0AA86TLJ3_9EUKA|nr:Hypothetical protein HINF_LOCUS8596 [Hexamita inflata]
MVLKTVMTIQKSKLDEVQQYNTLIVRQNTMQHDQLSKMKQDSISIHSNETKQSISAHSISDKQDQSNLSVTQLQTENIKSQISSKQCKQSPFKPQVKWQFDLVSQEIGHNIFEGYQKMKIKSDSKDSNIFYILASEYKLTVKQISEIVQYYYKWNLRSLKSVKYDPDQKGVQFNVNFDDDRYKDITQSEIFCLVEIVKKVTLKYQLILPQEILKYQWIEVQKEMVINAGIRKDAIQWMVLYWKNYERKQLCVDSPQTFNHIIDNLKQLMTFKRYQDMFKSNQKNFFDTIQMQMQDTFQVSMSSLFWKKFYSDYVK